MKTFPLPISALALTISSILAYPALVQAGDDSRPPLLSGVAPAGIEKGNDMSTFSQSGHSAMATIGDARLAIFNGDPTIALRLMESAKTYLAQAEKEAPYAGRSTSSAKGNPNSTTAEPKMRNVPVDGQLVLADDFEMTPEKKMHIDKANESFKKGDHASGLEQLRLGAIAVNYTRWWLPLAPSETHLDQAIKLANEAKYYEANLALKSIEDSVTVDSISFSELAKTSKSAKTAI